jgi:hypothetical protein|tara:strand:+ start:1691 stop:1846 length:156 start_codon:yes stop_codon:yes gene_type:complete
VQKISVPMGAGHWVVRWAVLENQNIRMLFVERTDAMGYMERLVEDWSSKDE